MAAEIAVVGSADQKLCEVWSNKLKQAQTSRQSYERQWHQNLAFYHGKQWIVVGRSPDGNGFVLTEAPVTDKFRVRHTANRIKRIIRQELTKLSKEEPQFGTKPASTDESDRAAAMAADAIAEYLLYSKYFNKKRTDATLWAVLCGTSFIKNWYDPNAIELDGLPGKVDFEAVTAFHLFVPYLQEPDLQKQPWAIHARVMSPEEVWNTYEKEIPPNTDVAQTLMDAKFMTALGIQSSRNKAAQMCYVKECWVRPNKEFPNGAMFVVTENQLLYCYEPPVDPTVEGPEQLGMDFNAPVGATSTLNTEPVGENEGPPLSTTFKEPPSAKFDLKGLMGRKYSFPYAHGKFPFAKIDHIPTGAFYADSSIKDLIPLQKEYNRTRSIMLETRNLAGKPQWSYIKGAINPQHFNSKPALLLAVNLGFEAPKPLDQPELPASIIPELDITLRDMDWSGGTNEIAQGRTPPGVEAASAIAYLQEENDTILYHTVQSLEAAVQETGSQILSLVHEYWDIDRIVTITSRNQAYEVKKFKASSLKPNSDFRVEPGSMAPRSSAAKQAFMVELLKMGIPGVEPRMLFKYLQFNETNALYGEMMQDTRHAQRENMKMAEGEPVNVRMEQSGEVDPTTGMPLQMPRMGDEVNEFGEPTGEQYIITVNSFDNHEEHIKTHQGYMKTQEWELLPDDVKQIFEDHVDEHKKELVKEMMYSQQGVTAPGGQPEQPIQEGEVVNA